MFSFASKITNSASWRIDADGFLRVTMSILKGGVFEYSKKDIPEEIRQSKPDLEVWRVRITSEYSDEFMRSVEGKPVVAFKHDWKDVNSFDKQDICGSLAGSASITDGHIVIDAIVNDADTISAIQNGELVDTSAGYHSSLDILEGDAEADAIQIPLELNHVALLPKGLGRCGPSVRILNAKEENKMVIKMTNSKGEEKTYEFQNESDAAVAESMLKEQGVPKEDMEAKNHELDDAKQKFGAIEQALASLEAEKKILEERIKQYESEEYQESQMKERAAYNEAEKSVIENGCDEGSKKELDGKLANAKSMNERMKIVTAHVCNSKGIDYKDDNAKVLFGVLSRTLNKASVTEVRKPVQAKTQNEGVDKKHPLFWRKG